MLHAANGLPTKADIKPFTLMTDSRVRVRKPFKDPTIRSDPEEVPARLRHSCLTPSVPAEGGGGSDA